MELRGQPSSKQVAIGLNDSGIDIKFLCKSEQKRNRSQPMTADQLFNHSIGHSGEHGKHSGSGLMAKTTSDAKWGRWLPANRYNVDQVPLPSVAHKGKAMQKQEINKSELIGS